MPITESGSFDVSEHGIWTYLPSFVTGRTICRYLSLGVCALTVYLIAELTNANVLLRISSRALSSTYAYIVGIILFMHGFIPGLAFALFILLSYFTLFATYQQPSPVLTFLTYIMLSLASFVFPKSLVFIPIFWLFQSYLRSFSLRCFMASFFGLILPYWMLFGALTCVDGGVAIFAENCLQAVKFSMPDYSALSTTDILIFVFVMILFLVGFVDCIVNAYLDKTRTRIIYNVINSHTLLTILFILLQPQFFHTLLPILLVDASLVGGHYISQTYNKFSAIYFYVMLAFSVALLILQTLI